MITDPMKDYAIPYLIGKGLDLGLGKEKVISSAKSVRKDRSLKPDIVSDIVKLKKVEDLSQDYVFASMVLQKYAETIEVINSWKRVLKISGRLIVTVPVGEDVDSQSLDDPELETKQLFTEKTLWLYFNYCNLRVIEKRIKVVGGKRYLFFVTEK